jgi:hypothetical protein
MAAPVPPQGAQQPYSERVVKVYGEQYRVGQPLPMGVRTTAPGGEPVPPYVVSGRGIYQPLQDTDWIISNRYTGMPMDVLSDEEFRERFGEAV